MDYEVSEEKVQASSTAEKSAARLAAAAASRDFAAKLEKQTEKLFSAFKSGSLSFLESKKTSSEKTISEKTTQKKTTEKSSPPKKSVAKAKNPALDKLASGTLSLKDIFGVKDTAPTPSPSPKPKKANPKKVEKPKNTALDNLASGTLSLKDIFGTKNPTATPAPTPVAKPSPAPKKNIFSFLGSDSASSKKTPVKAAKKSSIKKAPVKKSSVKKSGTISLFGGSNRKTQTEKKVAPVKKSGTISLFGASKKSKPLTKVPSAGKKKVAPKDNIPVLKKWKQASNGEITGEVSNSKNFRKGEVITTSPVRQKGKKGAVVTTGSGSKYRLM